MKKRLELQNKLQRDEWEKKSLEANAGYNELLYYGLDQESSCSDASS
jgi:hypothetical protein